MSIPEVDYKCPKEHIHTFKFVFNKNPFSKIRVYIEACYSYPAMIISHDCETENSHYRPNFW